MSRPDPVAQRDLAALEAELNTRWPETKIDPTMDRIAALTELLGTPQRSYPVLHVAGTNGKTSTARMIDSLLTGIGLRTGRFTSPHLQSVTERIALDNHLISPERYLAVYADIEPYVRLVDQRSTVPLSKFEVLTGMAFAAFADAPVDVAILEVGLGGTWDTTNVADAEVAVIGPIGVDHVEYLGSDIAGIAAEKAGVIKPEAVAIIADQPPEVARVVYERCAEVGATVARSGQEFGVMRRDVAVGGQLLTLQGLGGVYDEIFLPLHGEHQAGNAVSALAAVEAFFGAGPNRQLDVNAVREAFASVRSPGRLERVRSAPTVLVDAAHNPHGAAALASALRGEFAFRKLVGVLAIMGEKDAEGILTALEPVVDEVVLTQNSSRRGLPPDVLAATAKGVFGEDRILVEPRLAEAIEAAVELSEQTEGDEPVSGAGVVVTGSVVTAGDARVLFGKEPG